MKGDGVMPSGCLAVSWDRQYILCPVARSSQCVSKIKTKGRLNRPAVDPVRMLRDDHN